jgi:hypothetical protein
MDTDVIEAELTLPIPGVSYSALKLRAARKLPPNATGEVVRSAWDALTDELVAAHRHEAERIRDALFAPEKSGGSA